MLSKYPEIEHYMNYDQQTYNSEDFPIQLPYPTVFAKHSRKTGYPTISCSFPPALPFGFANTLMRISKSVRSSVSTVYDSPHSRLKIRDPRTPERGCDI